jgi:hypothetical protein
MLHELRDRKISISTGLGCPSPKTGLPQSNSRPAQVPLQKSLRPARPKARDSGHCDGHPPRALARNRLPKSQTRPAPITLPTHPSPAPKKSKASSAQGKVFRPLRRPSSTSLGPEPRSRVQEDSKSCSTFNTHFCFGMMIRCLGGRVYMNL